MPEIIFLGTKGEIEESAEKHCYHSSMMLVTSSTRFLIDYGLLHRYSLEELKPDVIFITHAHPDHYIWLKEDIKTAIPVYLTRETLDYGRFQPGNPMLVEPGKSLDIRDINVLPYRVIHSLRAPAVGFKLTIPEKTIIYNSDLVDITEKESVLTGVDIYIGDGSSIRANLVRRRDDKLFGHTRITTQINWCRRYGISRIIFIHLGKETLAKEDEFAGEHPDITLAFDGMEIKI